MLANLYNDKLTVYRSSKTVNEYGRIIQSEKIVYDSIPCRLSQKYLHTTEQNPINKSTNTYKIFLEPNYEIKQNDDLLVVKAGIKYKFKAGKSFKYDDLIPHQEILVEEVEKNAAKTR